MTFYTRLYRIAYTRFGKVHVDHLRDKTVACAVAANLARALGASVNVFEAGATPANTTMLRLFTTIRPK